MKLIYSISLSILFLIPSLGFSQDKELEKANKKYEQMAYVDAIKLYEQKLEDGYESAELYEKLASSYYLNGDLSSAVDNYFKLFEVNQEVSPEVYFRYAHALKSIGEYSEADRMMETYKLKSGNKTINTENYLDKIRRQSGRYTIENLEVNSNVSDFAPSFYKEQLIFSSARDTGKYSKNLHKWDNNVFNDLFVGEKLDNGISVAEALKFSSKLNTKYEESTTAFTSDGKTVYFTRSNYVRGKRGKDSSDVTRLKILRAKLNDRGVWGDVEELPFNSDEYSVAHPTLSPDDTKLYFSSDMPGSLGLSDIYVVDIQIDGTFKNPINLGSQINTPGRETFPFMSNTGFMYFASDGHLGLGGLDIFVAKMETPNKLGTVYNVGEPINSQFDDFSFIINDAKKVGYFASNREGGKGSDDIYSFIENEPLMMDCIDEYTGIVVDSKTKAIIPNSLISLTYANDRIASVQTNNEGKFIIPEVDCNKEQYIVASKTGYVDSKRELISEFDKGQIIELDPVVPEVKKGDDLAKVLKLNPIYFDTNKSAIRTDAKIELDKVVAYLLQYPSVKIEIGSHTDSRGSDANNLSLSKRRAKSTASYMTSRGIDSERVTWKGYGESSLLNKCANGVKCSKNEHQLNRRSEFIILQY